MDVYNFRLETWGGGSGGDRDVREVEFEGNSLREKSYRDIL